jgi:hypothetical protein
MTLDLSAVSLLVADLRAMDQRRLDCALAHEVDDAVAARAAAISTRISPGLLAVHVTAAMRQVLADESWPCEEAEPEYLAPSYRWTLVLEALQTASRDGQDDRHPRSAEWQQEYGRGIPGQDCASQLAVIRWYQGAFLRSPGMACHGLIRHLAAATVAGCG